MQLEYLLKNRATPLSNKAMNYVFSSNEDVNTLSKPVYKKIYWLCIATTKDNFNEWVTVKANVKEHFKKFHKLDLDEINGLAIMADTDNSKLSSIAYFQNIYFSAEQLIFYKFFKYILTKDKTIAANTSSIGDAPG